MSVTFLLLACLNLLSISDSYRSVNRIVGGQLANITDHPYQVSLQIFNQHSCGGSIIHYKYILTAAHCVYDYKSRNSAISVVAGTNYWYTNGTRFAVTQIYVHPKYDPDTLDYDIAILELSTKIKLDRSMLPIALPRKNEKLKPGAAATATGWGALKEGLGSTRSLRRVTLPVLHKKKCKDIYKHEYTDRMFCAGFITGGKDACQGDSGGPLESNGKLIGIVSWGNGCAKPDFPGVYTNVAYLRDWIDSVVHF
ncbi:trypsin-2 [Aethina tumida]|uniref:trypsin-2 n=1 Tax=Aethina tumida TaxID=116153 RepID=UPI002147D92F|nr:trypsin-2 [Aethina tumida]